jgi:tetratricopeptide (TPR) repeat protein
MRSKVLWALDNEIDGTQFERLCTDLLAREGYTEIMPIGGGHDNGRDAEIRQWKGFKATGGTTFFQFSLEERWEKKLTRELKKIQANGHQIDIFVFVTSRKVTGHKRDALTDSVHKQLGWQLVIYDREWLRHRLEEAHPDLAVKYLQITSEARPAHIASDYSKPATSPDSNSQAWQLYKQGDYEAAAVALKQLLKSSPAQAKAWKALAWCQYSLYRYKEALVSVSHAVSLDSSDNEALALKASILVESGIDNRDRASIVLALGIFERLARDSQRWVDHYNYGNALHALRRHKEAKGAFLRALEYDPTQAQVWKNLGSTYFHLDDHQEELACYERALALNPNLVEALISKASTLLNVFSQTEEAVTLFEKAIQIDPLAAVQWPHVRYWLSLALFRLGNPREALKQANLGLDTAPDHSALLALKAAILSTLWREDDRLADEARAFFEYRLQVFSDDRDSIIELVRIYAALGDSEKAWGLLKKHTNLSKNSVVPVLASLNHALDECLLAVRHFDIYRKYRKLSPVADYERLLYQSGLPMSDLLRTHIFIACAIPFACAYEMLQTPQGKLNIFDDARTIIFGALSNSFPVLSPLTITAPEKLSTQERIEKLSKLLVAWPDIALMEASRQIGFLASQFNIPEKQVLALMERGALQEWWNEVMGSTLIETNRHLKLLKD